MLVVLLSGVLTGCAFYGFSGASIPPHLETIAIPIAEDNTTSPVPNLGRELTTLLSDRFVGRTRLSLDNNESNADAVLTARVVRYSNRPTGVGADEQASSNEVRLEVRVRYYDQVKDSTLVEQSFTGSITYPPRGLGAEEEAVRTTLEDVADDIFNTATSNW